MEDDSKTEKLLVVEGVKKQMIALSRTDKRRKVWLGLKSVQLLSLLLKHIN